MKAIDIYIPTIKLRLRFLMKEQLSEEQLKNMKIVIRVLKKRPSGKEKLQQPAMKVGIIKPLALKPKETLPIEILYSANLVVNSNMILHVTILKT